MAALFREGNPEKLTAEQVLVAYLNRIGEFNGTFETYDENGGYNAFVRIDRDEALEQARLADLWLQNTDDPRGPAPPLCGIPMAVKDTIGIGGRETSQRPWRPLMPISSKTDIGKLSVTSDTLEDETQRDALLEAYRPDANDALAGAIPFSIRLLAEERRRQQQTLFDQALEQYGIDFRVVLPIGAHIVLRFDEDHRRLMPVRRAFVDLPNALAWPMVTFPIGHGRTGLPLSLPINAAFWGPRFSEALLVQAAMDFQYHYPEYHNTVPPEPEFGPAIQRPPDFPRVRNLPPEYSTDPLILEKDRRVRLPATESHGKGIIWRQFAALRKAWNAFWNR